MARRGDRPDGRRTSSPAGRPSTFSPAMSGPTWSWSTSGSRRICRRRRVSYRRRSGRDGRSEHGAGDVARRGSCALDVGARVAADLVVEGARCLLTGDMGIGNTTPAAAIVAAFTGRTRRRGDGARHRDRRRAPGTQDRRDRIRPGAQGPRRLPKTRSRCWRRWAAWRLRRSPGSWSGQPRSRVPVLLDGVIAMAGALAAVTAGADQRRLHGGGAPVD